MKKFYSCVFTILLLCTFVSITAYAWTPSYWFNCQVNKDNIPNGTKYIDILMPINENDKYYVPCNSDNCKLYNIPENSEIVSYNLGGYKSYTFHICDAYSLMKPELLYTFNISEADYNGHKELLKPYDDYRASYLDDKTNEEKYVWEGGNIQYNVQVYLEDKEYTDFWKAFSQVKLNNFNQTEASVDFNTKFFSTNHIPKLISKERNVKCDYQYCCLTYKTVKFAYIDDKGNILGVSNAVSVYEKNLLNANPLLTLQLSGLTLSSNFQYSPMALTSNMDLLGYGVLVLLGIIIIILIILFRARKKKKLKI